MSWSPSKRFWPITGLLSFGTVTAVTAKAMFDFHLPGIHGITHNFEKPWFQTTMMFIGMALCLIIEQIKKCSMNNSKSNQDQKDPLLSNMIDDSSNKETEKEKDVVEKYEQSWKTYLTIFIPAMCDLIATALMMFGLVRTTVSVNQMLRGAMVVFGAILTVFYIKRPLHGHHYLGITLVLGGMVTVGCSSLESTKEQKGNPLDNLIGMLLVVASQLVQATQLIIEEVILKKLHAPPLRIVGVEGLWGTGVMAIILLPICYAIPGKDAGAFENTYDTFIMLGHSSSLIILTIVFWIAISAYNHSGMVVTQVTSAVHRTIIEAVRTCCIWVADLLLYYVFTNKKFGEQWNVWSWLQLVDL